MSIISSIILLGSVGAAGAVALNRISKRFHVDEDPRIAQVEAVLPGANCGACGYKGCHDFAANSVTADSLDGFFCPSAGKEGMQRVAALLGKEAVETEPRIAIVRCAGTYQTRTRLDARYHGPRSCAIMNMGIGDYACANSCLGCGDCVAACSWGAIAINSSTGLPEVNADKCVGCGMCATACPRKIIKIRGRGIKGRRVWVACSNCQRGAVTRKQCTVGCIGCGLCKKACRFEAITIDNNLARIDADKCKTCGKCITVCPQNAIHYAGMTVAKPSANNYEEELVTSTSQAWKHEPSK